MILEDLYASKAECNKFEQIKKELVQMIRLQAPSLNIKVGCKMILCKKTLLRHLHICNDESCATVFYLSDNQSFVHQDFNY